MSPNDFVDLRKEDDVASVWYACLKMRKCEVYEINLGECEHNAATYYLVPHIYEVIGMHDHQKMEKQ